MNPPVRFTSIALAVLSLSALESLLGCSSDDSSSNAAPIVDSLDMPATATIGASGNYEINGVLSAHDPDGVIAQIMLEIPGYAAPTMNINRQTLTGQPFTVQIDGRSKKGPLTANAKIVDDDGASVSKSVTVTLQ